MSKQQEARPEGPKAGGGMKDFLSKMLLRLTPGFIKSRICELFLDQGKDSGRLNNLIRGQLARQYYAKHDDKERRKFNREKLWGAATGARWHQAKETLLADEERFRQYYYCVPLVSYISEWLAQAPHFQVLCDIGTGNGLYLDHLSRQLPSIQRFIGIDLNAERIERNKVIYRGRPLEFVHTEAIDWIRKNAKPGTLFVTVGTLAYATPNELPELLQFIQSHVAPTALALSEPVDYDTDQETESRPRGECAYSHPYPHLLRQAGFSIHRSTRALVKDKAPRSQVAILASSG